MSLGTGYPASGTSGSAGGAVNDGSAAKAGAHVRWIGGRLRAEARRCRYSADLKAFNNHLIAAVLTGHPLLINDGHIIMHPAIKDAVLHPESSPLQKSLSQEAALASRSDQKRRRPGTACRSDGGSGHNNRAAARQRPDSYTVLLVSLRLRRGRINSAREIRATSSARGAAIAQLQVFHKRSRHRRYCSIRILASRTNLLEELEAAPGGSILYDLRRVTDWGEHRSSPSNMVRSSY